MNSSPEFVSLSDVVDAIASEVEPPQKWQDSIRKDWLAGDQEGISTAQQILNGIDVSNFRVLLSLFIVAYQYSEAAAILDSHIQNTLDVPLRWFDVAVTGRPRRSVDADHEGPAILVYMSRYLQRYQDARKQGRFDAWPNIQLGQYEGKFAKPADARRFKEIGFDRDEIIDFLISQRIRSTLVEPVSLTMSAGRSTNDNLLSPSAHRDEAAHVGEDWPPSRVSAFDTQSRPHTLASTLKDAATGSRVTRLETDRFASALADELANAYRTGKNREQWKSYLESPPPWASNPPIRLSTGRGRGNQALWNPLEFAKMAVGKTRPRIHWTTFSDRFQNREELTPWRADWCSLEDYFKELDEENVRGKSEKPGYKTRRSKV